MTSRIVAGLFTGSEPSRTTWRRDQVVGRPTILRYAL